MELKENPYKKSTLRKVLSIIERNFALKHKVLNLQRFLQPRMQKKLQTVLSKIQRIGQRAPMKNIRLRKKQVTWRQRPRQEPLHSGKKCQVNQKINQLINDWKTKQTKKRIQYVRNQNHLYSSIFGFIK